MRISGLFLIAYSFFDMIKIYKADILMSGRDSFFSETKEMICQELA